MESRMDYVNVYLSFTITTFSLSNKTYSCHVDSDTELTTCTTDIHFQSVLPFHHLRAMAQYHGHGSDLNCGWSDAANFIWKMHAQPARSQWGQPAAAAKISTHM
jgi:hypothetical protein